MESAGVERPLGRDRNRLTVWFDRKRCVNQLPGLHAMNRKCLCRYTVGFDYGVEGRGNIRVDGRDVAVGLWNDIRDGRQQAAALESLQEKAPRRSPI